MAQKTKVKELVGRGLNSYHTKALQQIDRIEKKNKEQNHKISILSNELDNDYLTKTEEGSVISLEHSKEGMVYLDELQGNTLVNYCTDGSKEMTLNGDIDVEGTFITTTEGVDNGKVDVLCEGNTLVNYFDRTKFMIPKNTQHTINGRYQIQSIQTLPTKVGDKVYFRTKFSVDEFNTTSATPKVCVLFTGGWRQIVKNFIDCRIGDKEEVSIIREHPQNLESQPNMLLEFGMYGEMPSDVESGNIVCKYTVYDYVSYNLTQMFGKGNEPTQEWCDKNLPYIEGMKSVGQDDESGHKIEILSQNKNLFNINETDVYSSGTRCEKNGNSLRIIPTSTPSWASYNIKIRGFKNGETYALSCISDNYHLPKSRIALYEKATNTNIGSWDRNYFTIPNNVNVEDIYLRIHCCDGDVANIREVEISDILIEKGQAKTQFIPYVMNKKEILLNEPLRKSNDNVKDRFVKIGNKYYIERNCQQLTINGNEPNVTWRSDGVLNNNVYRFWSNNFPNCITLNQEGCIYTGDYEKVHQANAINVHVSTSKITEDSVELFVEYLKQNPLTVVIKRATPIYEPIEDAELITYLDTTHISNNSIIPCTMKVKNNGYNAIIKPSTLYTIALDTNKSGTIGMNLGGAKVTTTNNVATITTPATLTDDSLRLYGKGIKSSKVRLLEGDKTNWIPSFFEGMKSSFEDKFDSTDNTYKMEILSNNKNLMELYDKPTFRRGTDNSKVKRVDDTIIINGLVNNGWEGVIFGHSKLLKKNTSYALTMTKNKAINVGHGIRIVYLNKNVEIHGSTYLWNGGNTTTYKGEFKTINEDFDEVTFEYMLTWDGNLITQEYNNLILSDIGINDIYTLNKSNKIQFSSIEPLRAIGDVKDMFVFKDGKLMIERNLKQSIFNNNTGLIDLYNLEDINLAKFAFRSVQPRMKLNQIVKCDKFSSKPYNSGVGIESVSVGGSNDLHIYINKFRLPSLTLEGVKQWLQSNPLTVVYQLDEPTYEEMPYELQKIILEGYENGTLFIDTNIPPTSTITYAGETPIVKSVKLNKTEVLNNTNDINDNIIPYLMDMDYRVVCLQLQSENINDGVSMARLFGGTYEMLQRDIQSKRYSMDEYKHRLDAYLDANKITEEEYNKLGDMLNE